MIIKLIAATNTKGMFVSATPGTEANLTKEQITANACALVFGIMTNLSPGMNQAIMELFLKHSVLLEGVGDDVKKREFINNGMLKAMRQIAGDLIEISDNEKGD